MPKKYVPRWGHVHPLDLWSGVGGCSVTYCRKHNHNDAVTSILSCCTQVLEVDPDVIVLSGSMCIEMLDIFQQVGVAVLLQVKRAELERISRVTGAIIFDSIDYLETVGKDFWVRLVLNFMLSGLGTRQV